ncbi:hypothetical protein BGZ88_006567 [Linnemannia elongata]|nr:hypothetical protein BGZ88_006567 [Linnemannia elongata]
MTSELTTTAKKGCGSQKHHALLTGACLTSSSSSSSSSSNRPRAATTMADGCLNAPHLPPAIITAPSTPTPSPALPSMTSVTPPPASPTTTDSSGATLVPIPITPSPTTSTVTSKSSKSSTTLSSSGSRSRGCKCKSERHHQQQHQEQPKKRRRPPLDLFSRSTNILFLIFQHLRKSCDQTKNPSTQSTYEFTTIHRPHSTATCTTVKAITESRIHDLVQDAFSKICRVNRAFAKVGLPFLWERPKIRTCRQLDRFAYTLQHHGWQYFDYIQEVVVRQGSIPDANNESLWWGHARCRAILLKIATECTRLRYLDCNWAGSPFDHTMVRSLTETSFIALKVLRLEPVKMPSKEQTLSEDDFNRLITCCPNLESLDLDEAYKISDRSVIHVLMTCQNLAHFSFPSTCISGWVDAIDMGFGENLRSIKIYTPSRTTDSPTNDSGGQAFHLDDFSFRPHALQKLESIYLDIGEGDFVNALFSKPQLPALRSLRILHPSNKLLKILSARLAPQLTMFETKVNDQTDQEIYKNFSRKMTSSQSLDCSPGPVMGLIGCNITTLSANSSLRLLESIAELCPKLEDLTLWGGSISRDPTRQQRYPRSDPQSGMIYVIEMCPIKRLRLVNAYLGFGPRFWQACGEFGTHLEILDIELFDRKGMNSWGMFEGLRHCKKLQWLRLTELLGVQKQVMMSCLKDLTRLCALYLSIPDLETGCFSISMDEIALFLSSFCELSEVNLIVPKPCPSSATTTPRSSMDLSSQRQFCYGLPYARADPTMVFKNALDQNIYGRVSRMD